MCVCVLKAFLPTSPLQLIRRCVCLQPLLALHISLAVAGAVIISRCHRLWQEQAQTTTINSRLASRADDPDHDDGWKETRLEQGDGRLHEVRNILKLRATREKAVHVHGLLHAQQGLALAGGLTTARRREQRDGYPERTKPMPAATPRVHLMPWACTDETAAPMPQAAHKSGHTRERLLNNHEVAGMPGHVEWHEQRQIRWHPG